jgi:hypothetical protein
LLGVVGWKGRFLPFWRVWGAGNSDTALSNYLLFLHAVARASDARENFEQPRGDSAARPSDANLLPTLQIRDWSTRDYTFFLNTLGVGLCFFSLIAGALQRYFHNYKWVQLAGICMRAIGMGLVFFATGEHATDVNLVMAQVMISLGVSLEFSLRAG